MNPHDSPQANEPECEVKMFFDEQHSEQANTTDFGSGIVIKDHFTKTEGGSSSKKNSILKMHDPLQRSNSVRQTTCFDDIAGDNEDGFSEITNDHEAMRLRRQMMAQSTLNRSEIDENDPRSQSDFISRSAFGQSLINLSSSSSGSIVPRDCFSTDLERFKIKIFEEKTFQKGPECSVCKARFGWFTLRQHHCRFCSLSCCQLCSTKRINKLRSCDTCFVRLAILTNSCPDDVHISSFSSIFEFQRQFEELVDKQNKTLINERDLLDEQGQLLTTQSWKLSLEIKEKGQQCEELLSKKRKTLIDQQYDNQHQKQNISYLKGVNESKTNHLEEKKKILYEMQQKLMRLKGDNLMKTLTLEQKTKKKQSLQDKLAQLSQANEQRLGFESRSSSLMSTGSVIQSTVFNQSQRSQTVDNFGLVSDYLISDKEKSIRQNSINQSQQMTNFEPKTHNVAPKMEKNRFCINQGNFS